MHLYRGSTEQFIGDAVRATLANQLAERFVEEFRYKPSPSEVTSWHHSLSAMSNALQLADLRDQGILVELKLPLSSKRLDVLITGSNASTGSDSAVIVELKQWTKAHPSHITDPGRAGVLDRGAAGQELARPTLRRCQRSTERREAGAADLGDPGVIFRPVVDDVPADGGVGRGGFGQAAERGGGGAA